MITGVIVVSRFNTLLNFCCLCKLPIILECAHIHTKKRVYTDYLSVIANNCFNCTKKEYPSQVDLMLTYHSLKPIPQHKYMELLLVKQSHINTIHTVQFIIFLQVRNFSETGKSLKSIVTL